MQPVALATPAATTSCVTAGQVSTTHGDVWSSAQRTSLACFQSAAYDVVADDAAIQPEAVALVVILGRGTS